MRSASNAALSPRLNASMNRSASATRGASETSTVTIVTPDMSALPPTDLSELQPATPRARATQEATRRTRWRNSRTGAYCPDMERLRQCLSGSWVTAGVCALRHVVRLGWRVARRVSLLAGVPMTPVERPKQRGSAPDLATVCRATTSRHHRRRPRPTCATPRDARSRHGSDVSPCPTSPVVRSPAVGWRRSRASRGGVVGSRLGRDGGSCLVRTRWRNVAQGARPGPGSCGGARRGDRGS